MPPHFSGKAFVLQLLRCLRLKFHHQRSTDGPSRQRRWKRRADAGTLFLIRDVFMKIRSINYCCSLVKSPSLLYSGAVMSSVTSRSAVMSSERAMKVLCVLSLCFRNRTNCSLQCQLTFEDGGASKVSCALRCSCRFRRWLIFLIWDQMSNPRAGSNLQRTSQILWPGFL